MYTFILTIHVLLAVLLIGLILIQQGKGADAGATFGAGGSGTVFGSGQANFITRMTTALAALFFVTSITLAIYARHLSDQQFAAPKAPTTQTTPNQPATP